VGEARTVLDRMTEAMSGHDPDALGALYAPDAVALTPDEGEVKGREAIVRYLKQFIDAFPDFRYEPLHGHESGNTAIDEGYVVGTNTGPLVSPTGESMPATGNSVRLRACDVATVEGGVITRHNFYFDQMDFMDQLGLMEGAP
jgi:ketosteroid isomerase-like protein